MKVGIMGGTFDPIHIGHLIIAEEVRQGLGLDEVLFIPTGQPWMKEGRALSEGRHRLTMVRIAVASNPHFRVSSVEIDHPGPTYTVDTLTNVQKEITDQGQCYFILGTDSFCSFPQWKEPERILELCTLVVVGRPGYPDSGSAQRDPSLYTTEDRVIFLPVPWLEVSGTDIRRRVARDRSIRYLTPEQVEQYIYDNGLYSDAEVADG